MILFALLALLALAAFCAGPWAMGRLATFLWDRLNKPPR